MRIAYLCHERLPSWSTYAEQLTATVYELARAGIGVDVVHPAPAGRPPRPSDAVRQSIAEFYGQPFDDVTLDRTLRFVELGSSTWASAALHDLRAWRRARQNDGYDIVYTRDLFALLLCVASGMPAVLETFRADISHLARFAPWRAICYRSPHLRGVVTHSHFAAQAFIAAGVPQQRVLTAHNGIRDELASCDESRELARVGLGLPQAGHLVCYAGHVGRHKGIECLIEVAASLPEVAFLVVGGVPGSVEFADALQRAASRGTDNVRFVPRVEPPAVARYLRAADILIIPPTAAPMVRYRRTVLPMKTFAYLAAGRPIVAPRLPDLQEVLDDDRNAVLVPPDDIPATVSALRLLLGDEARQRRLAAAAAQDSRRYTWRRRAERIATYLQTVAVTER